MEQEPSVLSMLAFPVVVLLYLLPTIVALGRGKDGKMLVVLLNVFLGWTVIAWLVAMVLALTGETTAQRQRKDEQLSLMRRKE